MAKKLTTAAGLAFSALLLTSQASSQTAAAAFLSPPSTEEFPTISAFLDVRDTQGNFLPDLGTASISVVEDGVVVQTSSLSVVRTDLQFVLAVNIANSFAIIDQQGKTRFDYIIETIKPWAASASAEHDDDLSLATPAGVFSLHQDDYLQWISALEQYQPAFQTAVPSLTTLSRAIEIAAEAGRKPGASRVVLWLTPALGPNFNADMLGLAEQARQQGVRVFVWMIDSRSLFETEQAATLQALASQTGGRFFAFSGIEPVPDLTTEFETIRQSYEISYVSRATNEGVHELYAVIQADDISLNSSVQSYNLDLSPPVVEITNPPLQISRRLADRRDPSLPFEPRSQALEIAVAFPDSIDRELVRSTLLVDGEAVEVNEIAPFDRFAWDLTGYTKSVMVNLSVVVEDALGQSGVSLPVSVQITVEGAPSGFQALLLRYGTTLVLFIVLVAAAVLLLVFVLAGRIQPRPLGSRKDKRTRYEDPVTQPLPMQASPNRKRTEKRRKTDRAKTRPPKENARRSPAAQEIAFLEPLEGSGGTTRGDRLPITAEEVTIGQDAQRSQLHIEHPTIEPLHARLWMDRQKRFFVADLKTTSGTWVNYVPTSPSGSRLQDGDLLHLGTVGFRFHCEPSEAETTPIKISKQA